MNKITTSVVGIIAVVGLVLGVSAYNKASAPVESVKTVTVKGDKGDKGDRGPVGPAGKDADIKFGAAAGPDFYNEIVAFDNIVIGGKVNSVATTATAYTLSAREIDARVLTVTPNGASLALTLPATSTLNGFIPVVGQTKQLIVRNATTTAGIQVTFVGSTGTTLKRFSTSTPIVITGDTDAANYGVLTFVRRAVGNVDVFFQAVTD
jgi:hypothetical protein